MKSSYLGLPCHRKPSARPKVRETISASFQTSGAQTVARKALWSGPQSNFHWKENLTLESFKRIFIEIINSCGPWTVSERQMWPTSQKVWAPLLKTNNCLCISVYVVLTQLISKLKHAQFHSLLCNKYLCAKNCICTMNMSKIYFWLILVIHHTEMRCVTNIYICHRVIE